MLFIRPFVYAIILLAAAQASFALALPENHSINGGITIVPIDMNKEPIAYFHDKRIPVLASIHKNQWLLVVGIPLTNKALIDYIDIRYPTKTRVPFQVGSGFYPTQSLTISDMTKVDPRPQDLVRIKKETQKLTIIYAHYLPDNPFKQQFIPPLRGLISSLFGLQRVYNHKPRDPHSGLDIAAPQGKAIYAANEGIVVETADYFFTGNTVIVNHGMGVFSLYAHLSKILVKTGSHIKRGQKLGLVGMTGRVTGPHLHWTMIINQTLVNPLLFVPARQIVPPPAVAAKKPTVQIKGNKPL